MGQCFLGTLKNEEPAHENPRLVENELIFAIAATSKSTKDWVAEFVKQVLYELGYSELNVAIE